MAYLWLKHNSGPVSVDDSSRELSSEAVNTDRFSILYDQVYDDLWKYCQRRSPSSDEALEVLGDTMLVLWQRLDDIPPGSGTRPWVFGVARNQLRKRYSGRQRRQSLTQRLVDEFSVRRRHVDPAVRHHTTAVIAAMSTLSDDDQELLRLVAWEELMPSEIAEIYQISENAASVRLHRARRRLEAELEDSATTQSEDPDHPRTRESDPLND